ncbi:hypothetical protein PsorP6_001087 [Peronosclerospora sorghi]|uniref:Uncharacterized protein n=1 Tax=Peronosclerospora sorghi TaxID=230839 RepID=A0ACC0WU16_9STRA|nr:hypothetical protein PsorP6_001087 [Peronosclerospora sorghi]
MLHRKHSKCPIDITCAQLPDTFPAKAGRLCRELRKPSMYEFATWMRLVTFIEGLKVAPSLINVLGTFSDRDVRRSLHFLEVHLPNSESSTKTNWRWQHEHSEKNEVSHGDIPAWTTWSTGSTSFDPLTSNLLVELSAAAESMEKLFEDKGREEKQAEVNGPRTSRFEMRSTDIRQRPRLYEPRASSDHVADLKAKFELPLAYIGASMSSSRSPPRIMVSRTRVLAYYSTNPVFLVGLHLHGDTVR